MVTRVVKFHYCGERCPFFEYLRNSRSSFSYRHCIQTDRLLDREETGEGFPYDCPLEILEEEKRK